MRAVILERPAPIEEKPLKLVETPRPSPARDEVLIDVKACGVCRTDLHIVEGELKPHKLPVTPGHQVVGVVREVGEDAGGVRVGDRVGVPWLYWACGTCRFCRTGLENLCDSAVFTGYDVDGGYAECMIAKSEFVHPIPPGYSDEEAAPLLCGGAIGYRALRLTGLLERGGRLGLFGYGSSAHMILPVAVAKGVEVYVFTESESKVRQALEAGAAWAGSTRGELPVRLDAAIVFAPAGWVAVEALRKLEKGGRLVLAGIYMTPIERLEYELLWLEREVKSVANVTRRDVREFLEEAARAGVRPAVKVYRLEDANEALLELKHRPPAGSIVLSTR
ncbi:MAG: zinc-dependent alcohol dehydrogenase family protein [Thermofilaceae archaeon]